MNDVQNILSRTIVLFNKNKIMIRWNLVQSDILKNDSGDVARSLKKQMNNKEQPSDNEIQMWIREKQKQHLDAKESKQLADYVTYNDSLRKINKFNNLLPQLSRYGIFMANVTQANTPEEVNSAIESAALPVGSSAVKKYSDLNIAVQAYLGAYWIFTDSKSTPDIAWNNRFGATAPIGISVSYGLRNWGAVSLYGSLIDIGAIVDYDLKTSTDTTTKSTTTTKDYKIELGQIFSPGVYLVYGGGLKIPLSIGIGGQYGPGLGKINNGTTVINNPSWRWNIFLSVDIPMFNLFTKTWHPWKHCVGR
jgi:hypothetical protein